LRRKNDSKISKNNIFTYPKKFDGIVVADLGLREEENAKK